MASGGDVLCKIVLNSANDVSNRNLYISTIHLNSIYDSDTI